jgi:hypothetical protein
VVGDQLVYIAGSGHSGSTLLDMCLGGHDQISSLGEVHTLSISSHLDPHSRISDDLDPRKLEAATKRILSARNEYQVHLCCCGVVVPTCSFWTKVANELQAMLGVDDPNILGTFPITESRHMDFVDKGETWELSDPKAYTYRLRLNDAAMVVGARSLWKLLSRVSPQVKEYRTIINNSLTLYEAARRAHKTPIIVDSTKNPIRMKGFYFMSPKNLRVIHLVRDGRAVSLSRMKRQNFSMRESARIWKQENRKHWLVRRTMRDAQFTRVHYEDLCRDPEKELRKICTVLGVEYQSSMLDFRVERHNLGGNSMRFRSHEREIHLDEKWRRELKPDDLRDFEEIAGDLNRALGYTT